MKTAPPLVRRGWPLATLSALVLLAHLWLADGALPDRLGDGASGSRPTRIEVAFVRQLAPSAAPPGVAAAATRPVTPVVKAPRPAASSPIDPPPAPIEDMPVLAALPEPAPPLPVEAPNPIASAPQETPLVLSPEPAASAGVAAAAKPFEWPPSTRISYRLSGNYRGPVEGQATVEWLRSVSRYQVFMDLSIGPSFAPLISRRVSSEGEVTEQGLAPRRYDEETKVVLVQPRRLHIEMGSDSVKLANGSQSVRPAGLQDSASQFVHLTWLFTTKPELLQAGRSVDIPLALPRVVETWTYDVLGIETLSTPAGAVPAVHVKPRREPKPGGDLTAEIWVAPSLQYLPVRILIRQDADTFIDLNITRLPEQAAPGK